MKLFIAGIVFTVVSFYLLINILSVNVLVVW